MHMTHHLCKQRLHISALHDYFAWTCSVAEAVVRAIGSRWPVRLGLLPVVPEALQRSSQNGKPFYPHHVLQSAVLLMFHVCIPSAISSVAIQPFFTTRCAQVMH